MVLRVAGRKPQTHYYLPILMGFLFLALFLGGCGGEGAGKAGNGGSPPAGAVRLFNWKDYTDPSVIADFEAETGIEVELIEYETTDEMIARVQSDPGGFDVIILDADQIPRMNELRVIRELDREMIPNSEGVQDMFSTVPLYDPEGRYGIPYQWGTTGLVINTAYVPPDTDSWQAMWDSRYQGRVGLLDDVRETLLPVMLQGGMSVNTTDPADLARAETAAMKLAGNGVNFGETLDLIEKVMTGELWMAETYGGDVQYLAEGREDIRFILPGEGFGVWLESMVISSNTANEAAAYALIDFFCRPDISARSASTFFYGSPIEGAQGILGAQAAYLPSQEEFTRGQPFIYLGSAEREYQRIFSEMKLEAGGGEGDGT